MIARSDQDTPTPAVIQTHQKNMTIRILLLYAFSLLLAYIFSIT